MQLCSCRSTPTLCERCRGALRVLLGGVAKARGDFYADGLWRRHKGRAWDPAKTRAIALRRVADLTTDPQLRELLAEDWIAAARRRWKRGDRLLLELPPLREPYGVRPAPTKPLRTARRLSRRR